MFIFLIALLNMLINFFDKLNIYGVLVAIKSTRIELVQFLHQNLHSNNCELILYILQS